MELLSNEYNSALASGESVVGHITVRVGVCRDDQDS